MSLDRSRLGGLGSRLRDLAVIAVLGALGFALVGVLIVPVVLAAVLAGSAWRRDPGRPLAFAAFLLLAVAALGTVIVVPLTRDGWTMSFASQRPLANAAARLAGVLAAAGSVLSAFTDRASATVPRQSVRSNWKERLATLDLRLPSGSLPYLIAGAAAVVIGMAVRLGLASRGLSEAYDPLIENLRLATTYTAELGSNLGPPAPFAPLAPLVVAYVPLSPRLLVLCAGLATMAVCANLARRIEDWWAGVAAVGMAAVLPSMWDVSLAVILASLCLVSAVMLLDGYRIDTTRAIFGGVLLGAAVNARPEVLLVLPLVMVWTWDRGSPPLHLGQTVVAAGAVMAPWWIWVHGQTGGFLPASDLAGFFNDPGSLGRPAPVAEWLLAVCIAVLATLLGRRGRRGGNWWILYAIPLISLGLAFSDFPNRDPLGWSAPLAVVAIATGGARLVRERHRPKQKRPHGAVTGPVPFGFDYLD